MTDLQDRTDITDLVSRLGFWLDDKQFDDASGVLADHVTVRTPGGTAEGIAAVAAQARRNHESFATQHLITNVLVDIDGDQATAKANLQVRFAQGDAVVRTLGERYAFAAERTDAGWRLTRIEIVPVWQELPPAAGPRLL